MLRSFLPQILKIFPKAKISLYPRALSLSSTFTWSLLLLFSIVTSPVLAQEAPAPPTPEPVPVAEEIVTPPPATPPEPTTPETVAVQYVLTYATGTGGTLTGSTSQTVNEGGDGTPVTAVPDTGYVFVDWSDNSTTNPRTDTAVSAVLSVTANFIAEPTPEEVIATPDEVDVSADLVRYTNYRLYQKYEKREQYRKYLRYRELVNKYPWENRKAEKKALKSLKKDYKKYQKSPSRYSYLKLRANDYANYGSLKAEYLSVKPFAGYGSNILFDKDSYSSYKDYGTEENRLGYERYKEVIALGTVPVPEEDEEDLSVLGPEITVGIFNYVPNDLKTSSFSIKANVPFRVLDREGKVKATIAADTKIRVKYLGDKNFNVYYSGTDVQITTLNREVRFSAEEQYKDSVVFDVSRPNSSFDHYRGSIRLRHYDSPVTDGDRVWVINKLPLEHYVWGMGEITGTGTDQYNRVMTTIFRTYGFWKIQWSTKYAAQGFKVDATSGSQIYYGYDWEITHDRIRAAAEVSRGTLVFYDGEVALTPYSSWTDGKTRRYEDGHWGHNCADYRKKTSTTYPWLSSVDDSYGKHPDRSTCDLASGGNHMVGLSANGAVKMARDGGYDYQSILKHFYTGITLDKHY